MFSPCPPPPPQLPYYMTLINVVWVGLWTGITFTTVLLVVLEYAMDAFADRDAPDALVYRHNMTMVSSGGGGEEGGCIVEAY